MSISKPQKKVRSIHSASDQNVTRTFIWNRAWLANQWILLVTPLVVIGLGLISYAAFALPAGCGVPEHPDGAVIRNASAGDPAVYLMKDGVRRGFPNEQIMASYGYNYGMVKQSTCGDQATRIDPALGFKQGTLVKGSGGGIYAIGGPDYYSSLNAIVKYGFPTWEAFVGLGYNLNEVMVIPDSLLNSITTSSGYMDGNWHPSGSWVYIGGTTYMVYNGQLLGVPTPQILASWHMPVVAKPATAVESAAYSKTAILAFNEGTLLQGSTNSIYALDQTGGNLANGNWTQKRGFTTQQVLNDLGYTFADAIHVADSALPVVTGAPITEPTNPPYGYVDIPALPVNGVNAVATGNYTFAGWAIDSVSTPETLIRQVDVVIDGTVRGTATWGGGQPRPDVCGRYPNRPGCPYVGWQFTYNTAQLTNGVHTIQVDIADSDPTQHYYLTPAVPFTVSNTAAANLQPDIYIDGITNPGTAGSAADGWAIDNQTKAESAITKISAYIDGGYIGDPTRVDRPDVCQKYPGRGGCPKVGWHINFNTASTPIGNHKLQVMATDATGQTRTVEQGFQITNGCGTIDSEDLCLSTDSLARSTSDRNPINVKEYHVLYVVPRDATAGKLTYDRHLDTNGSLSRTINSIQSWLRSASGGKSFNIDSYGGKPDITFVQVNNTEAYYATKKDNALPLALRDDITRAKPGLMLSNKKYVIFFEGGSNICGITPILNGQTTVLELRGIQQPGNFDCTKFPFDSSSNGQNYQRLVTHEMIHALGAVSGPGCADYDSSSPGHVISSRDLMTSGIILSSAQLDIGGDSYWGSKVPTSCANMLTNASSASYIK